MTDISNQTRPASDGGWTPVTGKAVEQMARVLWFDFVDQQGYPNGLPTWDEMAVMPELSSCNRCDEFLSLAHAAIIAMEPATAALREIRDLPATKHSGNQAAMIAARALAKLSGPSS